MCSPALTCTPLAVSVYLRTNGEDAQHHGVKAELERLKKAMLRVREIEDKAKDKDETKDKAKDKTRDKPTRLPWQPRRSKT